MWDPPLHTTPHTHILFFSKEGWFTSFLFKQTHTHKPNCNFKITLLLFCLYPKLAESQPLSVSLHTRNLYTLLSFQADYTLGSEKNWSCANSLQETAPAFQKVSWYLPWREIKSIILHIVQNIRPIKFNRTDTLRCECGIAVLSKWMRIWSLSSSKKLGYKTQLHLIFFPCRAEGMTPFLNHFNQKVSFIFKKENKNVRPSKIYKTKDNVFFLPIIYYLTFLFSF